MDEIETVQSEIVRAGHAYWLAKRGARVLPARSDFDPPLEVPKLIPNIILFDVLRDPLDFLYRLIGSNVRAHLMQELTGVRMSEVSYQRADSVIWAQQAWVVEHAEPRFVRPPYVGPHKDFLFIEAVILPCGADARVDKLMIFADFVRTLRPR